MNWEFHFYQAVNSLPSPIGKKLRKIEAKVFRSVKSSVLKEIKQPWDGSETQNSLADKKVRYQMTNVKCQLFTYFCLFQ